MSFEGYYKNDAADAERVRNGWYWTGDLGYVDEAGFLYFAGRRGDWIRVDGENTSALTIERVLRRHPGHHRGRGLRGAGSDGRATR